MARNFTSNLLQPKGTTRVESSSQQGWTQARRRQTVIELLSPVHTPLDVSNQGGQAMDMRPQQERPNRADDSVREKNEALVQLICSP